MKNIQFLREKRCFIFDLDGTLIDSLDFWFNDYPKFSTLQQAYIAAKPIYDQKILPKSGSLEFVKAAHDSGITCIIATATNLSVCSGCIKRIGYDKYIDSAFCCDDFSTVKTSPLFYNSVLKTTPYKKKDVIIFEDNASWAKVAYDDGFDIAAVYDGHSDDFERLKQFSKVDILSFFDAKKEIF
ncbi:MAG: HAD hydrolase-like protein [Clostridia bacterium]